VENADVEGQDSNVTGVEGIVASQKNFFSESFTDDTHFRRAMLDMLYEALAKHEQKLIKALQIDLGKPAQEAYVTEISTVRLEIDYARRHLKQWSRRRRVSSGNAWMFGRSYVHPRPYGVAAILSPWNYPVQLSLTPLVAAIAAGNTAIIKPSELAPATAQAIADMLGEYFETACIAVAQGGPETARELVEADVDTVFFTGSPAVGKRVAVSCAERLIPCTLELGGKSPAIIMPGANLERAARRIAWGKLLNAGQTCVAPDHVWVHEDDQTAFLKAYIRAVQEFYGDTAKKIRENLDYGRIVNARHTQRLIALLDSGDVTYGGEYSLEDRFVAPTVILNPSLKSPIMQEEIFGPILPLIRYADPADVLDVLAELPHPLAAYIFDRKVLQARRFLSAIPAGGGAINDCIFQVANPHLPFGGSGASGIGRYHGKAGFDNFSYQQSIVEGARWDLALRYPPYKPENQKLIRRFL